MQPTFIQRAQSIFAAALAVLGVLILDQNLYHAATRLCHLGTLPPDVPGGIASVVLAAGRACQAYASDPHGFCHTLLLHFCVSCWPLLLVVLGNVLSRDSRGEE